METHKVTHKKRKREIDYPRITYDAGTRTFDRLFKEDSLEGMKEVVRKKLGVSTSIPVHLSQLRDGKSVDLDDDDDFEAFRSFSRDAPGVQVKVELGSSASGSQTQSHGHSETMSPPKKKRRKSDASSTLLSAASAIEPLTLQKERHVAFEEPASKRRVETDANSATIDETERRKIKKKKKETTLNDESARVAKKVEDRQSTATGSSSNLKKRSRSQDQSTTDTSSSPAVSQVSATEDDLPSRPAKKSKKKLVEIVEESRPSKKSRSTSVPPPSTIRPSLLELRASLVKAKKSQKQAQTNRAVSEPPVAGDLDPMEPTEPPDVPQVKTKKKTKPKEDSVADAGKPSKTGSTTSKDTPPIKGKKANASLATQTTTSVAKVSKKRNDESVPPPAEKMAAKSSGGVEAKAPVRKKRKSEAADDASPDKREAATAALRAAAATIQALIARKGIITPGSEATTLQPLAFPAVANRDSHPTVAEQTACDAPGSSSTSQESEDQQTPDTCPICDESPKHDRPMCPVIKGGVKTMRKRVAELEKITSEEKEDERKQVIADLQGIIQKRSRKPKTANGVPPADKPTPTMRPDTQAGPASLSKAAKTAKQVDVASSCPPVVDILPPASSQPAPSAAENPQYKLPSLTSLKPSSSQKQAKSSAEPKKPKLIDSLPNTGNMDLQNLGHLSQLPDLSHFTDKDLQSLICGPKLSIRDVPSSSEDEDDEPDREEPVLEEEEEVMKGKASRRLSQSEYPSSSDEQSDSAEVSASKVDSPTDIPSPQTSGITEGEERDGVPREEPLLGPAEGDTLARDSSNQSTAANIDTAEDSTVGAIQGKEVADPVASTPSSLKQKVPEADSATVVCSQTEEVVKTTAVKTAKPNGVLPATKTSHDPIEPSEDAHDPDEVPESIASDDGNPPVQATPKVELVIRTRSQRNKESGQHRDTQEDRAIPEPKSAKKTKKITELPIPPNPSVRMIKTPPASNNRTRGQKSLKGRTEEPGEDRESPVQTIRTAKTAPKTSIKPAPRVGNSSSKAAKALADAVNKSTGADKISATPKPRPKPRPKTSIKNVPVDPEPVQKTPNNDKAFEQNISVGSQWAVLEETQITETPGQFDELYSDVGTNFDHLQTPAMVNGSALREPLFLPDTQQTMRSFGWLSSQRTDRGQEPSPHDSEDEDEVAAVITPPKAKRSFVGLSTIAGSQTFPAPKFHSTKLNKSNEVQNPYGRGDRDEDSEDSESDDSESADDQAQVASHIPASRRAGLTTSKMK